MKLMSKLVVVARARARSPRIVVIVFVTLLCAGVTPSPREGASPALRTPTLLVPARATLPEAHGPTAVAALRARGLETSLQAAFETARYAAHADAAMPAVHHVTNAAQGLAARLAPEASIVATDASDVRIAFAGLSYGGKAFPVRTRGTSADGARVVIQREVIGARPIAIEEWWVNSAAGLEQGFTVAERPLTAVPDAPLQVTLRITSNLSTRSLPGGAGLEFTDATGRSRLRYDRVAAWDAEGRVLPARMRVEGEIVTLEARDAGAVYPVTIDPTFTQQAYLKAVNAGRWDYFGRSVAVSGDTVVVGAPERGGGAVHVFVRTGTTWRQQAYLTAYVGDPNDKFGDSVAVSGDTLVVGAPYEGGSATGPNGEHDNDATWAGAAYVFMRHGTRWDQMAYLKASNTDHRDMFGTSVAVSGNTVVVGAPRESSGATGVNGPQADNSLFSAGAAYVFVGSASGFTWSQQAYVKASNTGLEDRFGTSVAVSGDTVVVGAPDEDSTASGVNGDQIDDSGYEAGATYVFVRSGTTWSQQAYVKASNTEPGGRLGDRFGGVVAVSGDTMVVGATGENSGATGVNGIQGDNSAPGAGAAYVFARSGTTWTQEAYLKASNTETYDMFGVSVSVDGDTVVVGAGQEASSATGVNGMQYDNGAPYSGAAYLYVRRAALWTQEAYLKASNTETYDRFGASVSVAGATVVVGAFGEESSATGVNGNQGDNSAPAAGAVYVFVIPPDVDRDGLPDDWETRFGVDPASSVGDNGASGDPDGDGLTNAQEFSSGSHPRGFVQCYLAEGATSTLFDTRLALLNPGATAATATLTFARSGTSAVTSSVPVPGRTRVTVNPETLAGMAAAEFSTKVESDQPLIVDRTVSWDAAGYGAHAETAVAAPALTWYLAEGATHSGFSLFYLLQNPNATAAEVRVRFLRPSGAPLEKTYTLPPTSRNNIWVNEEDFPGLGKALAATDVSAIFDSLNAQPIIVERALYLDLPGQMFGAGHESAGVTAPATQWFLAEGNTGPYFDLFVLIANPGDTAAQVEATYLRPDGTVIVKTQTVAANSRFNIWVDGEDPLLADTAVSTTIRSTNGVPVIVERALWWPGSYGQWYEAHNSPGATSTGTRWALAEGEVGGTRGIDTYILLANTSPTAGDVKVTVLFEDGTSAEKTFTVAANSRFNVDVRSEFPMALDTRFGAIVESLGATPVQIVVERAMYWDAGGQHWAAGTNALGTRLP